MYLYQNLIIPKRVLGMLFEIKKQCRKEYNTYNFTLCVFLYSNPYG